MDILSINQCIYFVSISISVLLQNVARRCPTTKITAALPLPVIDCCDVTQQPRVHHEDVIVKGKTDDTAHAIRQDLDPQFVTQVVIPDNAVESLLKTASIATASVSLPFNPPSDQPVENKRVAVV